MRTMSPNGLAILGAAAWMILVAVACGIAAIMVIGRAFTNKTGGGLADLILAPGLKVAEESLPIILIVSWTCWVVVGLVVIVLVRLFWAR